MSDPHIESSAASPLAFEHPVLDDSAPAPAINDEKASAPERSAPREAQSAQSLQSTAQNLTDQALHFLSNASQETIGACLVGIGATTYLVLGRVGLVLMGVVGGVVLHATWDGTIRGSITEEVQKAEERRRKDVSLDVVRRALQWKGDPEVSVAKEDDDAEERIDSLPGKVLDFKDFPPETQEALNELTDAVIRDYVKWWYSPIIPADTLFPSACRETLTAFILSFSGHMSRKRPADTFLQFLTYSSSIVVVFLEELSAAVNVSTIADTQDAIHTYLDMEPDSSLAQLVDEKHQRKRLNIAAKDILQSFLEHKAYSCEPVRTFLQQILAQTILESTLITCSRAEFINEWIVYLLEDPPADVEESPEEPTPNIPAHSKSLEQDPVTPTSPKSVESAAETRHKRVVSKAQEAMDEAMQEAARLTQLIAEDDARRQREQQGPTEASDPKNIPLRGSESGTALASSVTFTDDASESTNQGVHTPTSSQSESIRHEDTPSSKDENSQSRRESDEKPLPNRPQRSSTFTNFDQLIPNDTPTALLDEAERKKREPPPLTLHKAAITIMDDSDPSDRSAIRNKPVTEYLIQVEPATSHYPGWMIVRRFSDFEALHQVLSRISKITDAKVFAEAHASLPPWKGLTRPNLRAELERYLVDAVRHQSLADCEAMKRFLEKDNAVSKSPAKQGFSLETVGKGMIDVLAQAPKGVAGGGKALIGGVTGVLGAATKAAPKRQGMNSSPALNRSTSSLSNAPQPRVDSSLGLSAAATLSQDSLPTSSPIVDTQPGLVPQMERRPSSRLEKELEKKPQPAVSDWPADITPVLGGDQILSLPPPPSDIPDDYEVGRPSVAATLAESDPRPSISSTASLPESAKPNVSPHLAKSVKKRPKVAPLSEKEACVAVELCFAVITELYKLSSAWAVRRALLNAAKGILFRPGNQQLDALRLLIQDTVLDANTSDVGIATHIRKLRLNGLPTEEELKLWPPERSPEQKEELRRKARKLLIERGMPKELNGVMSAAASGEALGKVFDALQIPKVTRGLMFGLMLQGLRAATQ